MRVAHICTRFSRLSETFVYDLLMGLEEAGVENHVLTAARENAAQRPFPRVRVLPIPLWRQAVFALRKRCLGIYRFPLSQRAAYGAMGEIRPDVILAHFGGAGASIAHVAERLDIPLVVVFHAFDLFMRHFQPATYAPLWASGARAVTVSEHGRRRLLALGCPAERVRVIHCGVDVERFIPTVCRTPDATGLRLVSIGRCVEKKGFEDLIRAVLEIRRCLAGPVHLDIWGDGPRRASLEDLVRELGLREVVSFRGISASQAVPDILRRYDAFVLSSKTAHDGDTEGIPVTILEAQAAGLPVVATQHAGTPEGIPPLNHGLLAREGDVADLAHKLLTLAAQRARWREIGMRGRAWVLQNFLLRDEVAAYRQMFDEVASAPAHTGSLGEVAESDVNRSGAARQLAVAGARSHGGTV